MFALMLIVLAGFSGLAIDFTRQERLRARLAQAADAATLAAARAAASMQESNATSALDAIALRAQEMGRVNFQTNTSSLNSVRISVVDLTVKFTEGHWEANTAYKATSHALLGSTLGADMMVIEGKSQASLAPGFPVLDIGMCIDSTGSMTGTLDAVKTNAINFYDNLNTALTSKGLQPFPLVRVRLMYYKDFGDGDGHADTDPLITSRFFKLPDESSAFSGYASPQVASGGYDWPESGLECLNEAMGSAWMKVGESVSGFSQKVTDVYPLLIVWTDSSSHRIAYPNSLTNPSYPLSSKMPRNYDDLLAKWQSAEVIDQTHKQLLFFGTPDQPSRESDGGESGWAEIMKWPRFTHGGTVAEANTDPIEFIATGIAKTVKGLRLTN